MPSANTVLNDLWTYIDVQNIKQKYSDRFDFDFKTTIIQKCLSISVVNLSGHQHLGDLGYMLGEQILGLSRVSIISYVLVLFISYFHLK